MSADQAKFAHQLILVTNPFLRPVDEREEKTHTRHPIGKAVNKAVRGWLIRHSYIYSWDVNIKVFLLILY